MHRQMAKMLAILPNNQDAKMKTDRKSSTKEQREDSKNEKTQDMEMEAIFYAIPPSILAPPSPLGSACHRLSPTLRPHTARKKPSHFYQIFSFLLLLSSCGGAIRKI